MLPHRPTTPTRPADTGRITPHVRGEATAAQRHAARPTTHPSCATPPQRTGTLNCAGSGVGFSDLSATNRNGDVALRSPPAANTGATPLILACHVGNPHVRMRCGDDLVPSACGAATLAAHHDATPSSSATVNHTSWPLAVGGGVGTCRSRWVAGVAVPRCWPLHHGTAAPTGKRGRRSSTAPAAYRPPTLPARRTRGPKR